MVHSEMRISDMVHSQFMCSIYDEMGMGMARPMGKPVKVTLVTKLGGPPHSHPSPFYHMGNPVGSNGSRPIARFP